MSTPETQALPPEVRQELGGRWKGLRLALTFVLVAYFIAIGCVRIVEGFVMRGMPNAGMVGVNGVLSLLIGLVILIDFPSSADWAIGLLVRIDLLFAGWGPLTVSALGKRLTAV